MKSEPELLTPALAQGEPSREFVQVINGRSAIPSSDVIVGGIASCLVQVGRVADAGEDLFDVMACDSSELGKYHAAFFKPHECDCKDSIRRQFVDIVDIYPLDLLTLHQAEIQPAFQKHGFGLLAVSRTIDVFGENCGLVAMKPFPLQFRSYLDPGWRSPEGTDNPHTAFRVASEKLRKHWLALASNEWTTRTTEHCARHENARRRNGSPKP